MKILVVCNSLMGLVKFRKELLIKLIEEKNAVYVMAPINEYRTEVEKLGCKFIELQMESRGMNIIHDLKLISNLKRNVKNINPNIVLTYTIKPNVYGGYVCQKLKIPYIANITGLGSAVENPGILQKITLFLYKIGLKKAKCIKII